jgi:catechol 2,3-dioxygenase-like lactoylglutathione lyase family enzyme
VRIHALDHLVLTVADVDATVAFYERLGMSREVFGDGRVALRFGDQKLNLHEARAAGIPVELGPVERTGAQGPIRSLYLCDPDGNLVELSEPITS